MPLVPRKREWLQQADKSIAGEDGGKNQDVGGGGGGWVYISARKTILWSLREGDGWKLICWIVIKNHGDTSS